MTNLLRCQGIVAIMLLTGCTTSLVAQRLDLEGSEPLAGWDYSLPFAQYDVILVRTLDECGPRPSIKAKATALATFQPDPSNTFTIDYRSLSSSTKISDLQVEKHPNGMLKKLGATAEDRTGPIIVNTATAIAKIAAAASGTPLPGAEAVPAAPDEMCTPKTLDALRERPKLRARVDAATEKLNDATTRLQALTGVSTAMGRGMDASTQRDLRSGAREVAARKIDLEAAARPLAKNAEHLTAATPLRWPTNGRDSRIEAPPIDAETLDRWFHTSSVDVGRVVFELKPSSPLAVRSPPTAATGEKGADSRPGPIRYRVPVKGKLVLYPADAPTKESTVVEGPLPQLGRIYLLPMENKAFENNLLNATFSEDGNLLSAGYAEKSSSAEAATEAAAKVAAMLPQVVKDVRLGGAQREAEDLAAETAVLAQKAKLRAAREALDPAPTEESEKARALLVAETSLMTAERARIAANYLLEQARLDPSTAVDKVE